MTIFSQVLRNLSMGGFWDDADLAGGFLILVVDGGVRFSFGVFIKPLVSEFSWERGAITLAYSLNMLVFGLCQPIAGKLLDRFGPKILFSISSLTASTGLILTSQISSTALLFGFTLLASAPLASAIMGDLYGLKNIGVLTGTIFWFHHLGGALGAYSGGFLYDLTSTYFVAFIISLCLSVIAPLTSISIIEKGS